MKSSIMLSISFLITLLFSQTFHLSNGQSACVGGNEYACLDWTFGSDRMVSAAGAYQSGVHFGVGSYERPANMGKCYEFKITSSPNRFVLQVVNEGPDVESNQIDMQMGAGGVGLNNACTEDENRPGSGITESGSTPMYPGPFRGKWGVRFGGWFTREECSNLPECPTREPAQCRSQNLQDLCRRAWDWGARQPGNADITSIKRIKCPKQLYEITGLRLTSDDQGFDLEERTNLKLTSMMDCCKPSAGFESNVREPVDPKYPSVISCRRDGYSRF